MTQNAPRLEKDSGQTWTWCLQDMLHHMYGLFSWSSDYPWKYSMSASLRALSMSSAGIKGLKTEAEHRTERLQEERETSLCFAVLPLLRPSRQPLLAEPDSHKTTSQVSLSSRSSTDCTCSLQLVVMCSVKGHFRRPNSLYESLSSVFSSVVTEWRHHTMIVRC